MVGEKLSEGRFIANVLFIQILYHKNENYRNGNPDNEHMISHGNGALNPLFLKLLLRILKFCWT